MADETLAPELRRFEKDVGTWDGEVELRPPGQPVQAARGVSTSKLVAGGKWLVTDFKNLTTGFEGHGVYGWDAARKLYTAVWVDPMRSSLIVADGVWDEAAKSLTYTSRGNFGGQEVTWRDVFEWHGADTQVFRSIFPMPDGSQHEVIKVTYRRRK